MDKVYKKLAKGVIGHDDCPTSVIEFMVKYDPTLLKYVEDQPPELCLEAVRENGLVLRHVIEQTPEICLAAVQNNSEAFWFVEKQTPELCMIAVRDNGLLLEAVIKQTFEICLAAVQQWGSAIKYVRNLGLDDYDKQSVLGDGDYSTRKHCDILTQEQKHALCLAAVTSDGEQLEHIQKQTYEICVAAIDHDIFNYMFIKTFTPGICLYLVKKNGYALRYIPEKFQTIELCITAIRNPIFSFFNESGCVRFTNDDESLDLNNRKRLKYIKNNDTYNVCKKYLGNNVRYVTTKKANQKIDY